MASRLSMLPRETCVLPPEEHDLLHEALVHWHDATVFPDERVAQVKALFKRIFSLPAETVLAGVVLPDAIVLQEPGDPHTFYALATAENDPEDGSWEAMELSCDGVVSWVSTTPFRLVLYFLSESSGGGLTCVDREPVPPETISPEIAEDSR